MCWKVNSCLFVPFESLLQNLCGFCDPELTLFCGTGSCVSPVAPSRPARFSGRVKAPLIRKGVILWVFLVKKIIKLEWSLVSQGSWTLPQTVFLGKKTTGTIENHLRCSGSMYELEAQYREKHSEEDVLLFLGDNRGKKSILSYYKKIAHKCALKSIPSYSQQPWDGQHYWQMVRYFCVQNQHLHFYSLGGWWQEHQFPPFRACTDAPHWEGVPFWGSWCPILSLKFQLQQLRNWCSLEAQFGQTGLSISVCGWKHSLLRIDRWGIKNWAPLKHAAKEWHGGGGSYHERCQKSWPRKRHRELEHWAPCSFPNSILALSFFLRVSCSHWEPSRVAPYIGCWFVSNYVQPLN